MYEQLVQPNLATQGEVGGCLKYAREVFGVGAADKYASQAWSHTKYKHLDENFPDVAILIWFDYWAPDKNGIPANPGHVAVRLANGQIYSSPYKNGTTHAVLGSINELIDIYEYKDGAPPYTMTYLGWSEDINGVRVAKEKSMTQDAIEKLVSQSYRAATDVDPTKEQAEYWVGRIREDNNRASELSAALGGSTYQGDPAFRTKARSYDKDIAAAGGGYKKVDVYVKE